MLELLTRKKIVTLDDPYWGNVVAYWDFEGADSNPVCRKTGRVLTGYNGVTQTDNWKRFGDKSGGLFTGLNDNNNSGTYFLSPAVSDWRIESSHYTVEASIMFDAQKAVETNGFQAIVGNAPSGNQNWYMHVDRMRTQLNFFYNIGGQYRSNSGYYNFELNTAYDVAVSIERVDTSTAVFRFFVNGILINTVTDSSITNFSGSTTGTLTVGRIEVAGYRYNFRGYIDEIRITKGVCRYKESYPVRNKAFPVS